MLSLIADENFNGAIVRGLRLRESGLQVVRTQDLSLAGCSDTELLAWANGHDRIILTHDRRTMPKHARSRLDAGEGMAGLFVIGGRTRVRDAINELLLVNACSEHREWRGQIVYFPL